MPNESDLRRNLDEKSTIELQDSIRNSMLTDQASTIARAILEERGASVPEKIQEDILENNYRKAQLNTDKSQLLIIVITCAWGGYGYLTGGAPGAGAALGEFAGALLITFLVTRATLKFTGRTRKGVLSAFFIGLVIVFGLRVAAGLVLDNGYGDIISSLIAYLSALAIWLRLDFVKLKTKPR